MPLSELTCYPTLDAHVHLAFMRNARHVASDAERMGLALMAQTVTPAEYVRLAPELEGAKNVRLACGLHPWWVADGRVGEQDLQELLALVEGSEWVGEVGLDYSPRRGAHEVQLSAFERVCAACGEAGGKVMSIHAVRSVRTVLDVLEQTGCLSSCTCILHWFSGSTDELWRAIRAGAWFSVNEMQAATRRAREQLRLIPEGRLLFETDLPPGEDVDFSAAEIVSSLARARELTEAIRAPR